ncbi:peptidase inhibitor family I36 protein [Actinomycetota bacterium Odt1-20B]
MRCKIHLLAGAVLISALSVVTLAVPSPAHADARAGALTVYKDAGFRGGWYTFTGSDSNLEDNSWNDGTGSVSDSISSLKNTSSRRIVLYTGKGYTGPSIAVGPGQQDGEIEGNNISSIKFL